MRRRYYWGDWWRHLRYQSVYEIKEPHCTEREMRSSLKNDVRIKTIEAMNKKYSILICPTNYIECIICENWYVRKRHHLAEYHIKNILINHRPLSMASTPIKIIREFEKKGHTLQHTDCNWRQQLPVQQIAQWLSESITWARWMYSRRVVFIKWPL